MAETKKSKEERLEDALLEYIEQHIKDAQPDIAATIPAAAMALVELWEKIDFIRRSYTSSTKESVEHGVDLALHNSNRTTEI